MEEVLETHVQVSHLVGYQNKHAPESSIVTADRFFTPEPLMAPNSDFAGVAQVKSHRGPTQTSDTLHLISEESVALPAFAGCDGANSTWSWSGESLFDVSIDACCEMMARTLEPD
jgi:hypothetical protein